MRTHPRSRRWRSWVDRAVAATMMVGALVSCGDSTGPEECLTNATLQINVFVDRATPRFEWVPRCLVSEVIIFDEATGETMWTVFSTGGERANTIASGLEYGIVPDDAAEDAPALALVPGTTYRVSTSTSSEGEVIVIGSRTFVP